MSEVQRGLIISAERELREAMQTTVPMSGFAESRIRRALIFLQQAQIAK